ncbi:BCD family MFS transporter [Pseudohaliea sp.]|uniref:BCD family MFS transporter n=1 Tax=Pseudohaliea sp. TaxID=2740289 RepID=UPI0032EB7B81
MNRFGRKMMRAWAEAGTRYMPFADVATPDLPLSKLLRLSLFQVSVGMALVLLVGTLNRVMIVELDVPASLVGIMLALPLAFAPFRALIGHRSDTHKCELGWRRVPFMWNGTLAQFGGFTIMPFAILVLAGQDQAATAPVWVGYISAALAFLLVGAGVHVTQTAGLALATDLTPQESHAKVVGLMYLMQLLGMIATALLFGAALANFSPGRLIQVIQGAAVATVALNIISLWKQETRRPPRGAAIQQDDPTFAESWAKFCEGSSAILRLTIVGLGTIAFNMADVLLEPFGGEVLGLSVSYTTKLTALFAVGGLTGFASAVWITQRGMEAYAVARAGALIGLPAFALVLASVPTAILPFFLVGNFLIGYGGALFAHGTLTATMNRAPVSQAGLALGAWGAVQATAAGLALAFAGTIRDISTAALSGASLPWGFSGAAAGYAIVYAIELALLALTIVATIPLLRHARSAVLEGRSAAPDAALAARGGAG